MARLVLNHEVVVSDILKNSGIVRYANNPYGTTAPSVNGAHSMPLMKPCTSLELLP